MIEGELVECAYWNVQLWNRSMQSIGVGARAASVNHAQAGLTFGVCPLAVCEDSAFAADVSCRVGGISAVLLSVRHLQDVGASGFVFEVRGAVGRSLAHPNRKS